MLPPTRGCGEGGGERAARRAFRRQGRGGPGGVEVVLHCASRQRLEKKRPRERRGLLLPRADTPSLSVLLLLPC